jgi:hypothetical protein
VIHRRRQISGAGGPPHAEDVVVALDRVSAAEIATEAAALGFVVEAPGRIAETERYLGSAVAMLRAPGTRTRARSRSAVVRRRLWRRSPTTRFEDIT